MNITEIQLFFLDLPIIKPTQTKVEVNETEDTTLNCEVVSFPGLISQYWTKEADGTTIIVDHANMSIDLILTNVKDSDSGIYTCITINEYGTSTKIFNVTVLAGI